MPVATKNVGERSTVRLKGWSSLMDPQRVAHDVMPISVRIIGLLARGLSTKEVEKTLDTSGRTVAYHKFRLMERHTLRTTEELILFAKNCGFDKYSNERC